MKVKSVIAAVLTVGALLSAKSETLVYKTTLTMHVPRVFDNTTSTGYRKMQAQYIVGYCYVDIDSACEGECGEPEIQPYSFYNKTHKVGGGNVTYTGYADNVMFRFIGNNKTDKFKTTCIEFRLDLNPSYNIGEDEPDNTLIINLSGYGPSYKNISGRVTGHIGCGCHAYGHKSPTRTLGGCVDDKCPLYGSFTMKLVATCK